MNGYLLALSPKKAKCKHSKLYFTGNAHAKEEFGNLQEIFKGPKFYCKWLNCQISSPQVQ
jgi:hypothetical protein